MIETRTVRPRAGTAYELLLTAIAPISHHSAVNADNSNRNVFNRRRQILSGGAVPRIDQAAIDRLCAAFPVPDELAPVFAELTFPQYSAVAAVRLFLDLHNRAEGIGVHTGEGRYGALSDRVGQSALGAHTMVGWWSALSDLMGVRLPAVEHDAAVLALLSVPAAAAAHVLRAAADEAPAVTQIARAWHRLEREARKEDRDTPTSPLAFDALSVVVGEGGAYVAEVPCVSGNSLRHQVVRGPAWQHLQARLGLDQAKPGEGPVPPSVEALFYNGGSLEGGAKEPEESYRLRWDIRSAYPSLDLLCGCCDAFDLGESRLKVHGWIACRENAAALRGTAAEPLAGVSVYDMLDEVTLTRQEGNTGRGQMIFGFEALPPGTGILVRLSLDAGTPELTHGALIAAVEQYLDRPLVGGNSARGFGLFDGVWATEPAYALADAYEAYLEESRDDLRRWLADGTLGCGKRVCS